ncbi:MAG: ABC transporter ATP-binding protein, partial [Alphaproteobacteria bacterium]|nr:ABC transporter ATP-binding protein [Alphaproteobacteria bacterium]
MTAILSVRDLVVQFSTRHGLLTAVDGVSFDLKRGQSLGLVGESGSGKSTLAKAVVGLLRPRTGSIKLDGKEIVGLSRAQMRPHRGRIQMVFQDPDASLNPRLTVGRIIEEPLLVHKLGNGAQRRRRVDELLERVGLRSAMARQFPHEFSGGQRQRIGIARALALNPEILVADEPVSALDVSVRGQVINLLNDLQKE